MDVVVAWIIWILIIVSIFTVIAIADDYQTRKFQKKREEYEAEQYKKL